MIKHSKYYDWILNRIEVDKNVKLIQTLFYDRWTGELKNGGSPFKEFVQYDNGLVRLIRLEYQRGSEIDFREHKINWQKNELISIQDNSKEQTYLTNFEYNELGLLKSEIKRRKTENELSFYGGFKYEYENIKDYYRLRRIKKLIKIPTETELQELFGGEIKYDDYGRIKEEILPLHTRDPHFDYSDKKIVLKFIHHTNLEIIEVAKTYSNNDTVSDKHYFKEINGVKYFARDFSVAQKMEFDNYGNLTKNGASRISYEFDEMHNWIRKFDSGKLIEERKITY